MRSMRNTSPVLSARCVQLYLRAPTETMEDGKNDVTWCWVAWELGFFYMNALAEKGKNGEDSNDDTCDGSGLFP